MKVGNGSCALRAFSSSQSFSQASPAMRPHPSKLFVELTTRCNLACSGCMKNSPGSGVKQGDMSRETFQALMPVFSTLEALVLNGVGESLLHPDLDEFVRIAREAMPPESWIGFQSNGLLLDERRALSLVDAGLDKLCLSLDAACPDMFRAIREGGELDDLRKAFGALRAARNACPGSRLQVGIEFVVMRDNLHHLPEVLRWSAAQGADFAIVSHFLPYNPEQIAQAVFDTNSDQAVALYLDWKRRAESEGVDLSQYFFINFYKFYRTDEEQRVVDFVREMVADARSRGIFFHLRNLLARDEDLAREVADVFAAAKSVAEDVGLDLKLPGLSPRAERRCDFIEHGSAMISWDGTVHPCYFLWHDYQCHFSYWRKYVPGLESPWGSSTALHFTNWKKTVRARRFGRVVERDIFAIWSDPSFRSFREEVLRDEYPCCSNCNLVPCDHLAADQFEKDCFDTSVPCGDCFWGLGIYHCLF